MKRVRPGREIVLDDPLPADSRFALLGQLSPRIGARIVERAGVERVRRNRPVDVVMPESNVIPSLGAELLLCDFHGSAIKLAAIPGQDSFDFPMKQEDVVFSARIGLERRLL